MFKLIRISTSMAFRTLGANPLHTLLSTLGIVIGVGALVAILALGDGMEKYGREQISGTTDLQALEVISKTKDKIDGVWINREKVEIITPEKADVLVKSLGPVVEQYGLHTTVSGMVALAGDTAQRPALLSGATNFDLKNKLEVAHGRLFQAGEVSRGDSVVILSYSLAEKLAKADKPQSMLNRRLQFRQHTFTIVGILPSSEQMESPRVLVPLSFIDDDLLKEHPPTLALLTNDVEQVPAVKTNTEQWLDANTAGGKAAFDIYTNDFRVEQVRKGIRVFKVVMGLITGIAIVVGGIGVMNVLLMSITERTREIGIRKAIGARRTDIGVQFLAEAMVISVVGSLLGFGLGMLTVNIAIPIVRMTTGVPFFAAFNPQSLVVVVLVAIIIGIVFGSYPAWKAAKLTPVEAIRRE